MKCSLIILKTLQWKIFKLDAKSTQRKELRWKGLWRPWPELYQQDSPMSNLFFHRGYPPITSSMHTATTSNKNNVIQENGANVGSCLLLTVFFFLQI